MECGEFPKKSEVWSPGQFPGYSISPKPLSTLRGWPRHQACAAPPQLQLSKKHHGSTASLGLTAELSLVPSGCGFYLLDK